MKRVIAYIDGYNLYHGLRDKHWKRFYWLNLPALAQRLLRPDQTLVFTKYFTTVVKEPEHKRRRQTVYLDALQTLPDFRIFYGQFLEDPMTCRQCGHTYITHHEKMTDVNIAVEMLADAYQDRFDLALLLSADSDLVGLVKTVQRLFHAKQVTVVFPPERFSSALKQAANATLRIGHNELAKSLFPESVAKSKDVILHRPAEWS